MPRLSVSLSEGTFAALHRAAVADKRSDSGMAALLLEGALTEGVREDVGTSGVSGGLEGASIGMGASGTSVTGKAVAPPSVSVSDMEKLPVATVSERPAQAVDPSGSRKSASAGKEGGGGAKPAAREDAHPVSAPPTAVPDIPGVVRASEIKPPAKIDPATGELRGSGPPPKLYARAGCSKKVPMGERCDECRAVHQP